MAFSKSTAVGLAKLKVNSGSNSATWEVPATGSPSGCAASSELYDWLA